MCPDGGCRSFRERDTIACGKPARIFDPLARLLVTVECAAHAAHGDLLRARSLLAMDCNPALARQRTIERRALAPVRVAAFHKPVDFPSHALALSVCVSDGHHQAGPNPATPRGVCAGF